MDNMKFNTSQKQASKESAQTQQQQQQLASTAIPWLISNGSVQQGTTASPRPSSERRKWCGCEPGSQCVQCRFLHLEPEVQQQAAAQEDDSSRVVMEMEGVYSNKPPTGAGAASLYRHVMSSSADDAAAAAAAVVASRGIAVGKTLLELGQSDQTANTSSDLIQQADGGDGADQQENQSCSRHLWQISRLKTDICLHPLRDQLLSAHLACLRVATPADQIPHIEAQAARASQTLAKYTMFSENHILVGHEKEELDHFMAQYVLLLCTFKEQLQQHVRFHANEAVMACYELEQCLLSLTGISSSGANSGATMSDDDDMDDEQAGESDMLYSDSDCGGASAYGSLIPSETERTLMERVRQELKRELQLGYKDRIVDVREEILRKRRAGKLPGDTTSVLKAWWQSHSKWPYPTEDEKMRLVQETGLQLKQINNWFINQRKRNWHNNPSSSLGALKSKRKR